MRRAAWPPSEPVAGPRRTQFRGPGAIDGTRCVGDRSGYDPGDALRGRGLSLAQVREVAQLIPSIAVDERDDSNVRVPPKRQGLEQENVVSIAVPQLNGCYVGEPVAAQEMARLSLQALPQDFLSVNAIKGDIGLHPDHAGDLSGCALPLHGVENRFNGATFVCDRRAASLRLTQAFY